MKRRLVDMHVHTDDSPDADIPAVQLVRRAVRRGLHGVGFVAHLDLHPEDSCHGGFSPEGYRGSMEAALDAAGRELRVLRGLEVGEPHRFEADVLEQVDYADFDFIVGGLHWTRPHGLVLGPDAFREHRAPEVIRAYLEEVLEIVTGSDIDILAHFGLFRRGMALAGLDPAVDEAALFPDLIREILGTMIRRDLALELNVAGLRRKEEVTYPTPALLRLYREMGGRRVTLGSDTHAEPWVFHGLEEGRRLLRETGFTEALLFKDRTASAYALG